MSREQGVDLVLLTRAAGGALVGWFLAVVGLVWFESSPPLRILLALLVGVVALSVLAAALVPPGPLRQSVVTSGTRGPEWYPQMPPQVPTQTQTATQPQVSAQSQTATQPWTPPAPGEPAPIWPGVGARRAPRDVGNGTPALPPSAPPVDPEPPTILAIPVSGGSWWNAASAGGGAQVSGGAAPDVPSARAVDLSDYPGGSRVVQCPRCGDFAVDVRQQHPGFAFTCERCRHQWRWEPGSPWPTTVVRPRLRGRQAHGGDAGPS